MAKESFLRGALILALASGLSRVIGVAYMVILPRLVYDEGMGLYQLVRPLHYFGAVIAISGIPVAVAKLVAEQAANGSIQGVRRIFRIGLVTMLITGSLTMIAMIGGASLMARYVAQDEAVRLTIMILGPACFFLALSAAFRGYFPGLQYMTPTAVAQVTDQIVRVAATVLFTIMLKPYGLEYAVAGVALGTLTGELFGWLVLLAFYITKRAELVAGLKVKNKLPREGLPSLASRLAAIAFPAVVTTVLWPIMQMADTLLIPARLQIAGVDPVTIRESVGYLGMALTVAQFPNIVTVALATSLVPAISEAWALGSKRMVVHRSEEAMRVALLFGVPSFAGLYVLARPIVLLLFNYAQAAEPLRILASGAITLGLIQSTTGILQGLGEMHIPVRNLLAGVALKFTLNYVLIAHPYFGALGAAWGTTLSWGLVAVLNLGSVFRKVGLVIQLRDVVLKPLFATGILAFVAYYLQAIFQSIIGPGSTVLAIVVGFLFYFLLLTTMGTITQRDLNLIPGKFGKKLVRFLYAWGFLRK